MMLHRKRGRAPRCSQRYTVPHFRRQNLGQHFLADSGYRRRIADSLSLRPRDLVIEIGAGRGAMTALLAERARHVVAIELDRALVEQLKEKFGGDPRIEILYADILSTDLAAICKGYEAEQCFVFGNLPYYITSPILDRLGNFRDVIRAMGLLVQREVADRLVAAPGSSDYGYLSVFVQLFSRPRLMFAVPPGAFSPPPKVHSAFVEFQIHPRLPKLSEENQEKLLTFVKRCFAQKRKNILNNLSGMTPRARLEQALDELELPATVRAEQMSIEQFAALYARLA
ncbi:MAG: 16S rRNA (adenine(1518)-N(6)/adenine(1519)-N(6))-dimethyltransferase RsmA [Terriglobia bacterium]